MTLLKTVLLWMVTRVLESIIKYFTSCYKTLHTSNRNKSTYTTFKVPKYLSRFYTKVWRSVNGSFVFFAAIWVVLYDRGKKTRATVEWCCNKYEQKTTKELGRPRHFSFTVHYYLRSIQLTVRNKKFDMRTQ